MFVLATKLTDTRFLEEKYLWQGQLKAVSQKQHLELEQGAACLRTTVEHLSDGSVIIKKRTLPVLVHPENQATPMSKIHTGSHSWNKCSYKTKKIHKNRSSCDLWNSHLCWRHQAPTHCPPAWEMKSSAPSGHACWHDLFNRLFSFLPSLKKPSLISLVTYPPVSLTCLMTVFKGIGLNCSFSFIYFWESIPKEKAFCRRMFTAALIILKSGEVKCATKGVLK